MKENYSSYLERYREAPRPEIEIIIPAEKFSKTNMDIKILSDYQGVSGKAIKTAEKGYVEWKVEVPEAGLYNLALKYYPVEGRSADIERSLKINGEVPFLEAAYVSFQRVWQDKGEILRDNRGNEIAPPQVESPIWLEKNICDEQGYYGDSFLFYFERGENTITIESQREPMVIAYLKIYQQPELPFYQEVVDTYQARGYQKTNDIMVKIQAENTKYKSSPIIYPIFDRGSANVEPYHPAQIRLNALGGQRWQIPGEWVIWEFEVPEDGLYKIAFKAMQNVYHGSYTNREISIDGQVPFQELKAVRFKFSNEYQMRVLGDDEENPYLFYLEKGKHTLQMKVVLGELASLLRQVEGCLYELNNIFRQIVMITSSTPDTLRDYQLEKRIPDVITNL
ncbi:MAG: ABC transporter substrate-binding protein, partial [Thermoanaerobacteraceae bacterium]|nr:ABC transporter substrate-binding protein [Thermoanaerobacteraceae bacterium]